MAKGNIARMTTINPITTAAPIANFFMQKPPV
jgi:hypothetical protein